MNNISWFNFTNFGCWDFSLGAPVWTWVCCGATVLRCCQCNWGPSLTRGNCIGLQCGSATNTRVQKKSLYCEKVRLVATNQMCWSDSLVTICNRSLRSSSTSYLSVLTVWYVVWCCTPRIRLIHLGATDVCIWATWSYFEFIFEKGLVLCQHWLCVVQSVGLEVVPKIIEYMY